MNEANKMKLNKILFVFIQNSLCVCVCVCVSLQHSASDPQGHTVLCLL